MMQNRWKRVLVWTKLKRTSIWKPSSKTHHKTTSYKSKNYTKLLLTTHKTTSYNLKTIVEISSQNYFLQKKRENSTSAVFESPKFKSNNQTNRLGGKLHKMVSSPPFCAVRSWSYHERTNESFDARTHASTSAKTQKFVDDVGCTRTLKVEFEP